MSFTAKLIGSVAVVGLLVGAGVGYVAIAAEKAPAIVADVSALPSFPDAPAAKATKAKVADVVPAGAQYRVRSGKSGVRYVACNEQRTFPGGAVELHCLSFSKAKGWGKSLRWIPRYQLAPLTGAMPAEPVATAAR